MTGNLFPFQWGVGSLFSIYEESSFEYGLQNLPTKRLVNVLVIAPCKY